MTEPSDLSFSIMNGECTLTSDAIHFAYDRQWKAVCAVFGPPSQKRSFIMAIVFGIPLIAGGAGLITLGEWHFGGLALLIGMTVVLLTVSTLFQEEYVHPNSIPLEAIEHVDAQPATTFSLGTFTITFRSDGQIRKTGFGLRQGAVQERRELYSALTEAFAAARQLNRK